MGLWQSIPELRQKVEALALKFGRFEAHMEECNRLHTAEAELAQIRHDENKEHLFRQDRRVDELQQELAFKFNLIIGAAFSIAVSIIGFLALMLAGLLGWRH
jgi:hypothetical protein